MFALAKKFGVVEETFQIADPWGFGLTLTLWAKDSRHHRIWLRDQARSSPATLAINTAAAREGMKQALRDRGRGDAEAQAKQFLDKALDEIHLPADQMDQVMRGDFYEAVALIRDWNAVDDKGKPIACTPENKRELLDDPTLVGRELAHAGEPLGAVLVQLIHAACDERAKARDGYLADAGKGSASTSAGDSEPSPAMPAAG